VIDNILENTYIFYDSITFRFGKNKAKHKGFFVFSTRLLFMTNDISDMTIWFFIPQI